MTRGGMFLEPSIGPQQLVVMLRQHVSTGLFWLSAPCSITPPVCGGRLHRWRGQPATGRLLSEYLRSHAGSVIKANLITAETLSMFSSSHQSTVQRLPAGLEPSSPGARLFSSVLGQNGAFWLFSCFSCHL